MKELWNWMIKNVNHITNFVAICLSLYLGIWYVPDWYKDMQQERLLSAQTDLQQSIKELIYADSVCTIEEVSALMQAKQLQLHQSYPYSIHQILTQVQDSFMQDRFLPLEQRRKLMKELEVLKSGLPPRHSEQIGVKVKNEFLVQLVSVIISVIVAIVVLRGWYLKTRTEKEKDQEIENQINEPPSPRPTEAAQAYERKIAETIRNFPGVEEFKTFDFQQRFDCQFIYKGAPYFVEVRYLTSSKVGLSSFRTFMSRTMGLEGNFWFIYNTGLTPMVLRQAREMRGIGKPIVLVRAEDQAELTLKLNSLLNDHSTHLF